MGKVYNPNDDDDDDDDEDEDEENEDTNEQTLPTANKNFGSQPFSFWETIFPSFSVLTNQSTTFLPQDKEMEQTFGKNTVIEEFPHGGIYDDKRFKTTVFLPEENENTSQHRTTFIPESDYKDIVYFDRRKLTKESKNKIFGIPVIKKLR